MLNTYTAAMYGVPVLFLSGDERICELSKELVPQITTVSSKKGVGGSAWNVSPKTVIADLKARCHRGAFRRCKGKACSM